MGPLYIKITAGMLLVSTAVVTGAETLVHDEAQPAVLSKSLPIHTTSDEPVRPPITETKTIAVASSFLLASYE